MQKIANYSRTNASANYYIMIIIIQLEVSVYVYDVYVYAATMCAMETHRATTYTQLNSAALRWNAQCLYKKII